MKKILLILMSIALLSSCSTKSEADNNETQVIEEKSSTVEIKAGIKRKINDLIEEAEDKSTIVYISYFDTAKLINGDFDEWTDKKIEYEEERAQTLISEMKKKGYKLENVFRVSHGKFGSLIYYIFEIEE